MMMERWFKFFQQRQKHDKPQQQQSKRQQGQIQPKQPKIQLVFVALVVASLYQLKSIHLSTRPSTTLTWWWSSSSSDYNSNNYNQDKDIRWLETIEFSQPTTTSTLHHHSKK